MDQGALLGFSARLYRRLLCLYPAEFRAEFGREMTMVFAACCREALRQGGLAALAAAWLATLSDLVGNALQEWACHAGDHEEDIRMTMRSDGSTYLIWRTAGGGPAFGERLTRVLASDPVYADTLVTNEPNQHMLTVVDSVALDADPQQPQEALALFAQLSGTAPSEAPSQEPGLLLDQLRDAVRRAGAAHVPASVHTLTGELLRRVYADPALFSLVSAVESDDELATLLEVLALDARADDLDEALALVSELSAGAPAC